MNAELLQFAGSLLAIAAVVALAHWMGLTRDARIDSEDEAHELMRLAPGGFEPVRIVLDATGAGALGRDSQGSLMALVPHGLRFVARRLSAPPLAAGEGKVDILLADGRSARFELGAAARDWAHGSGGDSLG